MKRVRGHASGILIYGGCASIYYLVIFVKDFKCCTSIEYNGF